MNKEKQTVKIFLKKLTIEKFFVRMIMAWLMVNIFALIKINVNFTDSQYAEKVNVPMYLCFILLLFIMFCALGQFKIFAWIEVYAPMLLITVYGFMAMTQSGGTGVMLGAGLFLAIAIMYGVNKSTEFLSVKNKSTIIIAYVVSALVFLLYTLMVVIIKYKMYESSSEEIGYIANTFHKMKDGIAPFDIHFTPLYYVIFPIYFLFPFPLTLAIVQIVVVSSGVVPIYFLCKKNKLSNAAIILFGILYAIYSPIVCSTISAVKVECMLIPLLFWFFYFMEKENTKAMVVFMILTLLVREDAAIYLICISVYMIISRKKYHIGGVFFLVAVLYYALINGVVYHNPLKITNQDFAINAAFVASECFTGEKIRFLFVLLASIGFLPFSTQKISRLILLLPVLIFNMTSYSADTTTLNAFGTTAVFFYVAIINYSELNEKLRRFMASLGFCMSVIVMPITTFSWNYSVAQLKDKNDQFEYLDDAMNKIPMNSTVTASDLLYAHLYDRKEVYVYPSLVDTDYVILDLRDDLITEEEINEIEKNGYSEIEKVEGIYVIFKRKNTIKNSIIN